MKPTIDDIAREAGVSKATVSRVINNKAEGVGAATRARIKDLIQQRGFEPSGAARGLATGKTRTIGLVVPDIADPFFALLIRGIEAALRNHGYGLFLCDSDLDIVKEEENVRRLLEKGVDGVILNSTGSDCDCQLELLEKRSVPFVLLDRAIEARPSVYGVYSDNQHGARQAAEWLLDGQPTYFGFINGPQELSVNKLRAQGVEDAFRARGLEADRLLTVCGDYTVESGEHEAGRLLDSQGAGSWALFAANDRMAIGALRAAKKRGRRVPEEVEIVGFDDIETSRLVEPPLTTVAQPAFEMGRESAELLLRLIAGKKPRKKTLLLEQTLVVRGTTRERKKETA